METCSIFNSLEANMPNRAKKNHYSAGSVHMCGGKSVRILERLPRVPGKHPRVVLMFTETGYVANVQTTNIASGMVKDRRERTVYGVGFLDTDLTIPPRGSKAFVRRAYDTWANMLRRSYGRYPGDQTGRPSSVDSRWHSFRVFLSALPDIPGYDAFERGENVHLDKDIRRPGNTVYGKDTCSFVPAAENIRESANRRWSAARNR